MKKKSPEWEMFGQGGDQNVDSIYIFFRFERKKIKVSMRSSPHRVTVHWTGRRFVKDNFPSRYVCEGRLDKFAIAFLAYKSRKVS